MTMVGQVLVAVFSVLFLAALVLAAMQQDECERLRLRLAEIERGIEEQLLNEDSPGIWARDATFRFAWNSALDLVLQQLREVSNRPRGSGMSDV